MSRLTKLSKVVYHNQLGSQLDRVERVRTLAKLIGAQMGKDTADKADQAAQIAKADLVTDMVGEFPELQGIMGRYYALADGLDQEVAEAIREQYLPRGAGDDLPQTSTGMALALADKLETLCGIFAVGQKPTGTKDPFGLRRAAIGLLRILIERKLPLNLCSLIEQALQQQPLQVKPEVASDVYDYIMERLRSYYLEGSVQLPITTEMFDAVLANRPASPLDFDARLRALDAFLKLSDAQALAAANKRINNILKKSAVSNTVIQAACFVENAERTLFEQLQLAETETAPLFAAANYQAALTRLAQLRASVDQFFDSVMVMADDLAVRQNRLALLSQLRSVFLKVADLSCLPG
jgi:glycyl-tRNA synthetase beta chain